MSAHLLTGDDWDAASFFQERSYVYLAEIRTLDALAALPTRRWPDGVVVGFTCRGVETHYRLWEAHFFSAAEIAAFADNPDIVVPLDHDAEHNDRVWGRIL